ncbi:MAG: alpha-L-fucosidase [Tannerella sp.]|nr:alpha-L-fucosidase [Tannerella sp.]
MKKYLSIMLCMLAFSAFGQQQTNERARWFVDSRYGMFIHWGLYSAAEGYWKGEKIRNDNDYSEWILYRNQIGKDEYLTLLDRFDWDEIDPEEWVLLAKRSGMKYITLTAKHHDGFALWDSKVSDYNLSRYTKRDIVGELAAACRKHGIRMGLYYSHWVDWEHPYGWNHEREINPLAPADYDRYWQEKVIPQIRELLTNYGEISMLWFDMWLHHSNTIVTREQLLQLKSLIRELQPNCLVNSRLGLSVEEDPDVDFKTLGDNQLGSQKEDFPWQSPGTVAHSWGYHSSETAWKSTTILLKSLIGNVSLNGNFMLNIGPRANGDVPYEIEQRLLEIGEWLNINGEAIYGAEAFDLDKNLHDWGKITAKRDGNTTRLYLHVYNWSLNKHLPLTGITSAPSKVYLLADKQRQPLTFTHEGPFTDILLPAMQPDKYVSVVVAEYDGTPEIVQNLAAISTEGGYSLTYENSVGDKTLKAERKGRGGTVPVHIDVKTTQRLKWKIYVDRAGEKTIDVSYTYQGTATGGMISCLAPTKLTHNIAPTGKTVGEPNSNWVVDRYLSHRIGTVNFPAAGIYELEFEIAPPKDSTVGFQWIWVK